MEISTETFKKNTVRTTDHVEHGGKMDHVHTHTLLCTCTCLERKSDKISQ